MIKLWSCVTHEPIKWIIIGNIRRLSYFDITVGVWIINWISRCCSSIIIKIYIKSRFGSIWNGRIRRLHIFCIIYVIFNYCTYLVMVNILVSIIYILIVYLIIFIYLNWPWNWTYQNFMIILISICTIDICISIYIIMIVWVCRIIWLTIIIKINFTLIIINFL